jgi:hypothetical protein
VPAAAGVALGPAVSTTGAVGASCRRPAGARPAAEASASGDGDRDSSATAAGPAIDPELMPPGRIVMVVRRR